MKADHMLLLTSCVRPFVVDVAYVDAGARQRDVEDQLRWLRDRTPYRRIVVCDSSGHDFSYMRAEMSAGVDLECLSFSPPNSGVVAYKAYGELAIYRHVLDHSRQIKSASSITKLTGRYRVASRCPLFFSKHANFVFSYNCVLTNDRALLTNLYRISVDEFAAFAATAVRPDDPLPLEFRLREKLRRGNYAARIAALPMFQGTSGTRGGSLSVDPKYAIKVALSHVVPYAYVGSEPD